MQPIRIIIENATGSIKIPASLLNQRIEIIMRQIPVTVDNDPVDKEIDRVFGMLKTDQKVSLNKMDDVIRKTGGTI